ncbi:hypothetical protein B4Q13_22685, partial [Lacticaseibacillus rhamnosus]
MLTTSSRRIGVTSGWMTWDFVKAAAGMQGTGTRPGSSRTNFALIGSFGTLLLATAPTKEEAEFYRQRLAEYRWTLSVSVKNAQFLKHAIESLDLSTMLAQNVPEKPGIEELMADVAAAAKSNRSRRGAAQST